MVCASTVASSRSTQTLDWMKRTASVIWGRLGDGADLVVAGHRRAELVVEGPLVGLPDPDDVGARPTASASAKRRWLAGKPGSTKTMFTCPTVSPDRTAWHAETRSAPPLLPLGGSRPAVEQVGVGLDAPDRQHPVARQERPGGDVALEQGHRAEPTGVGQLGRAAARAVAGRHADGGVERRGHDRRQPALGHDLEGPGHPAERRDLDDDEVGRLLPGHPCRVVGLADRLVRRDRDVDALPGQHEPQLAQLGHLGAGLLGVLQVVGGQGGQRVPAPGRPTTRRWRRPGCAPHGP